MQTNCLNKVVLFPKFHEMQKRMVLLHLPLIITFLITYNYIELPLKTSLNILRVINLRTH
jgi:uncharacterized membrane protein